MKKLIVALAAVALIGGCMKVNTAPPKDLPAFVKVYPGATQVVSMNVMGMQALAFQAAAKPDEVIAYYRTQATSDGLPETTANAAAANPGQGQATFGDPASGKFLVVIAKAQGDGSMVSLTYKAAKAPS